MQILVELSAEERHVKRRLQIPDTSSSGNYECFRNELYNGKPITIGPMWHIPDVGHVEFDVVSTRALFEREEAVGKEALTEWMRELYRVFDPLSLRKDHLKKRVDLGQSRARKERLLQEKAKIRSEELQQVTAKGGRRVSTSVQRMMRKSRIKKLQDDLKELKEILYEEYSRKEKSDQEILQRKDENRITDFFSKARTAAGRRSHGAYSAISERDSDDEDEEIDSELEAFLQMPVYRFSLVGETDPGGKVRETRRAGCCPLRCDK